MTNEFILTLDELRRLTKVDCPNKFCNNIFYINSLANGLYLDCVKCGSHWFGTRKLEGFVTGKDLTNNARKNNDIINIREKSGKK